MLTYSEEKKSKCLKETNQNVVRPARIVFPALDVNRCGLCRLQPSSRRLHRLVNCPQISIPQGRHKLNHGREKAEAWPNPAPCVV